MSKILSIFYKELGEWLSNGADSHPVFKRNCAICLSLDAWADYRGIGDKKYALMQDNMSMLMRAYPDKGFYPFNKNSNDYVSELLYAAVYNNQERVTWIYKQAKLADAKKYEFPPKDPAAFIAYIITSIIGIVTVLIWLFVR